jgi:hypothetical protein
MASTTTIGDSPEAAVQPVVSCFPLGIATQAQIADVDDPVNDTLVSGKDEGAMYLYKATAGSAFDIVVATGPAAADPWHKVSDAGAAPITPA